MNHQDIKLSKQFVATFVFLSISFFAFNVFISCTSKDKKTEVVIEPIKPVVPPLVKVPLSWEKNHEERYIWTDILFKLIDKNFASLDKAKDLPLFCPKYASLSEDKKKIALAELWVWTSYYESGWNPKSASVDVGTKSNKDTWSAGLLQVSVVDQKNWNLKTGYNYNDLLQVEPNLDLSLSILSKQIDKQGLIAVSKNLYWAVLGPKNYRYTKLDKIQSKVKALDFCHD